MCFLLSLSAPLSLCPSPLSLPSPSPLSLSPLSLPNSTLLTLRGLVLALGTALHLQSRIFSLFAVAVLHPVGAAACVSIAVFLSQDNVGQRSIRITTMFAVGWALLHAISGILIWSSDDEIGLGSMYFDQTVIDYWLIVSATRMLFYFAVIYVYYRTYKSIGRTAGVPFIIFEQSIYMFSTLFYALYYYSKDTAFCGLYWVWLCWAFGWPYITYRCLAHDSIFWGNMIGKKFGKNRSRSRHRPHRRVPILSSGTGTINDDNDDHEQYDSSLLVPYHLEDAAAGVAGTSDSSSISPHLSHESLGLMTDPAFSLDPVNLTVGEAIAEGATSTVHYGSYNGRQVAVKMFKCEQLTPKFINVFAQEAAHSHRLQHECIVECIGVCVMPPSMCIVQEFMNGGSLFRILKKHPNIALRRRLRMARDIARGVAFLHSHTPPILHRDLKSLNILVSSNWQAKLADLGEAKEYSADYMTAYRGTPHWMAPEVFQSNSYSEKADVYSLGILLWEIATQKRPYPGVQSWELAELICERGMRPVYTQESIDNFPSDYIDLAKQCWVHNPDERPDASQVSHALSELLLHVEHDYDQKMQERSRAGRK
jgi:tRNA A-37 threonylcarbamoyl transferase component Bud32